MKIVYVKVRLRLMDDANAQNVVQECDYSFEDEEGRIIDTEIIDIEEKD